MKTGYAKIFWRWESRFKIIFWDISVSIYIYKIRIDMRCTCTYADWYVCDMFCMDLNTGTLTYIEHHWTISNHIDPTLWIRVIRCIIIYFNWVQCQLVFLPCLQLVHNWGLITPSSTISITSKTNNNKSGENSECSVKNHEKTSKVPSKSPDHFGCSNAWCSVL